MTDIETEARELLAKHASETGCEGFTGLVTVPLALAAISELLTGIKVLEETKVNGILSVKLRDANETICEQRDKLSVSQALLAECREVLGVLISTEKDHGPDESDISRAASLIEKLSALSDNKKLMGNQK